MTMPFVPTRYKSGSVAAEAHVLMASGLKLRRRKLEYFLLGISPASAKLNLTPGKYPKQRKIYKIQNTAKI
jgi:hypothetical protein